MRFRWLCVLGLGSLAASAPAAALSIVPTSDEAVLQDAIFGNLAGLTVTSFSVSGHALLPLGERSTGTYTNASGTYGIGRGVVISTGDVAAYGDGPNTFEGTSTDFLSPATPADDLLLDPITGIDVLTGQPYDHFDVTRIDITFDAAPTVENVFFTIVFGSEEFQEFVGSPFIDAFGIYFNDTNIALVGGAPVNINHPAANTIAGTELDGLVAPGGNPLLRFQVPVVPGSTGNRLTFIVGDSSDEILDTTVFISGFGSVDPVAEPSGVALLAMGVAALAARRRRAAARA